MNELPNIETFRKHEEILVPNYEYRLPTGNIPKPNTNTDSPDRWPSLISVVVVMVVVVELDAFLHVTIIKNEWCQDMSDWNMFRYYVKCNRTYWMNSLSSSSLWDDSVSRVGSTAMAIVSAIMNVNSRKICKNCIF